MTRKIGFLASLVAVSLLTASLAFAGPATVVNQQPAPTNTAGQSQVLTQSQAVSGGTLYITTLKQAGTQGQPVSVAQTFVPTGATSPTRYFALTSGKSDLGVPMTATANTPTGTVGVVRVAGTSLQLIGETTSSNAKTDKVMFELDLPDTYVAGTDVPVIVNCNYSGTGSVTGASTTMTVAAYTETNGVEVALSVSAAQQMASTATNKTFTITGTSLVPGQHIVIELTMLVTSASGANAGVINSVAIQG